MSKNQFNQMALRTKKAEAVINSCITPTHYDSAEMYINLYIEQLQDEKQPQEVVDGLKAHLLDMIKDKGTKIPF